jgi:site-specific DNA recombinase
MCLNHHRRPYGPAQLRLEFISSVVKPRAPSGTRHTIKSTFLNVLTYARVSTQEQADRELSLPAQLQAMRDYAKRQGWTVAGEFVERGVSARTADRPKLREMLARCKQEPRVDVVLVHKIDRLARNVYDHASIWMVLKERAIKLASVVENVDDTVSGQLLENIMASLAQFYSANLGEEIRKGMGTMIAQGDWPHRPPRGYVIVKDSVLGRRIVIDPPQAAPIRRAFELYATGNWSLRAIRDDLEQQGVKTVKGKPIPIENIRWLFLNRFYAGRVWWHDAEYPGNHEPLVSPELFDRVQRMLKERHLDHGSKGKLHFWLRGVARCAECGARLTAERHDQFRYYRCIANTINSQDCRAFINADRADEAVARLLRSLCLADGLKNQLRAAATEALDKQAESLRSRSASFRGRKTRLEEQEQRLTEAFAAGDISLSAYKGTVAKLRQQIAACDDALRPARSDPQQQLQTFDAVMALAGSLWDIHAKLPPKQQTHLLRLLFGTLIMDRSGISSYKLNQPFDVLLSVRHDGSKTPVVTPCLEHTKLQSTVNSIFGDGDLLDRLTPLSAASGSIYPLGHSPETSHVAV